MVCAEEANIHELEPLVKTMELVEKKLGDADWILKLICNIQPGHELFAKGYAYVKPKGVDTFNDQPLLPNEDNFFSGLPRLEVDNRARFLRQSKQMRNKIRLAHLEYKKDKMQAKIDIMTAKILDDELREEFKGEDEVEGEGDEEEGKAQPGVDPNQ